MNEGVEAQVVTGRYRNVRKCFRDSVRRGRGGSDAKLDEMHDLLDRAEASGLSERMVPEIIELARKQALRQTSGSTADST